MEDSLNQFIQHLELEKGRSKNTLIAYRGDLRQFISILEELIEGPLLPIDLSQELLSQFHQWLMSKGYKPSTINRKWAAVRSFVDYLRGEGYLTSERLLDHLDVQSVERSQPVVLSPEKVESLLAASSMKDTPLARRDSAILSLMYHAGFRASDVVSLSLEDLIIDQGLIRSPWAADKYIAIPDTIGPIVQYLQHGRPHLARFPDERALFLNQRGSGLTRQGLWLIVKRWVEAAQIEEKVTPQTLRHSLAKHLLDSGWSLKEVQRKLGLKSPNSIRIFSQPNDRQEQTEER